MNYNLGIRLGHILAPFHLCLGLQSDTFLAGPPTSILRAIFLPFRLKLSHTSKSMTVMKRRQSLQTAPVACQHVSDLHSPRRIQMLYVEVRQE